MVEQNLWSKQTTVHFVFRAWDHPEALDRVCLEMDLEVVIASLIMSS